MNNRKLCQVGLTVGLLLLSPGFTYSEVKLNSSADIPAFYEKLKEAGQIGQDLTKSSKFDELNKLDIQVDKEWHEAVSQIGKMGKQAVPVLIDILKRRSVEIKSVGMMSVYPYTFPEYALAAVGKPAVPYLVNILSDSSVNEQKRILYIFQMMGPTAGGAGPKILELAKHSPDGGIREQASGILGKIKYTESKEFLLKKLKGEGPLSAGELVAVGKIGKDDAVSGLIERYKNAKDDRTKGYIIQGLGYTQSRKAVPFLIDLINRKEGNYRFLALARTGAPEAIPVFKKACRETPKLYGFIMYDCLPIMYKERGNEEALKTLLNIAKNDIPTIKEFNSKTDDVNDIRFSGIRGLSKTGSLKAVECLGEIYNDKSTSVEFKEDARVSLTELARDNAELKNRVDDILKIK